MRYFVLIPALLAISACGPKPVTVEELHLHDVKLPGGQVIQVEIMFDLMDMLRGMMFRSYLAPDRGMLFMHRAPGRYSYFMYQHLISLDMIWMDPSHRIVEIVPMPRPARRQRANARITG